MEKKPPSDQSGLADTDPAVADTYASDLGDTAPTTPDGAAAAAARELAPATEAVPKGPRQVRAGDKLGRYDLVEEIGEGGMATVFRARDRELRREVAVKVLFPHLARRTEVVRRFHREARAAAGLEHPNILRIYDVGGGEQDDPPFIVMELIRGRTLLEEIEQRGPIFAEVAACIGALLADALAAAHAKGIIHRDIKPSNVLIAAGGRLLLADFGVARLESEEGSSLVTRTGALLGTPAYMSPEQASGDTATVKSDLYSLGATLYQLTTGMLPYSGSPAKVMSQIAMGALIAPVKRRADVGPDLSRAIETMMAVDAQARPASAAAIATDLRGLAAAGGLGDATEELAAYFENPEAFLEDRTPKVVSAIVSAGKQAIHQSRLPRAMALADRASALAPEDPAVKSLIEIVTEGDRASRRRKLVAIAGASLLAVGGGAFALTQLGGTESTPDAAIVAQTDAATIDVASAIDMESVDTLAVIDEPRDAEIVADTAKVRDAAVPVKRDAAVTVAPVDAAAPEDVAIAQPVDALTVPPDTAAPTPAGDGTIVVSNDTWCDVAVDGVPKGKIAFANGKVTVKVPAGHHVVTCVQPGIKEMAWRREVDVEAGKTATIPGALLATVDVAIAITTGDRVRINTTFYARGAVAKLKPGRYRGLVFSGDNSGVGGFVDITRVPCRLHEVGDGLACDP